jgi:arabinofuranan 3-O-arabinosyltransferase
MTVFTREADTRKNHLTGPSDSEGFDDGRGGAEARPARVENRRWWDALALGDTKPLSRRALVVVALGFLIVGFVQSPGLIEFDTKLPLVAAPVLFFKSVLHLWNTNVFAGTVAQGANFLWPMGVFFLLTHALHVPVWVAERIWLAALFTVACWGVIRLAEALGIGNRWTRILAGVAYCIAPIFVTYVSTSGDLLPAAFLPWMLRPLVIGSREGSTRQAAARSGVAVAFMGGVNAAVTLATLPLAVIWFLTRQPGPRRRSLVGWWILAVALACFWWEVPLDNIAHFGYDYLPYTETSALTTSTTSLFESIRGGSFWINYFNINGPLLRAPWLLVSQPLVILGSAVLAAAGLAGLCTRIRERVFLVASMTIGIVVIAAGYSGSVGGPFALSVQRLLQGTLAPFRNVSKFSPDVALPLALGFAALLAAVWRSRWLTTRRERDGLLLRGAFIVIILVTLVAAATPFWRGELYRSGGFSSFPRYWQQAAAFLNEHQGHDNAMIVPGSSFGYYTWGNPVDEPIQALTPQSVEWRNIIPFGSNGYNQMVDAVEQALDSGVSPAGLGQFLAREGIDYVVERNDLNLKATGAPPPAQVHQVLAETPGLKEVASFGPYVPTTQVEYGSLPVYDSFSYLHLRPVEIYKVEGAAPPVQAYPAKNPVVVSGRVGSIIPLTAAGVLPGRAAVLSGDPDSSGAAGTPAATWAVTDSNQRRVTFFGGIRYNQSYVLGAHQQLPNHSSDVPNSYDVVSGAEHQAVEAPVGARSVAASSFGPTTLYLVPSEGPAAAFDNDASTQWSASLANDSIGQWLSISFNKPIRMSTIALTPVPGSAMQPAITKVKLTTDRGSVVRDLPPGQKTYHLAVVPGVSRQLKITLEGVTPASVPPSGGIVLSASISSVSIPGVTFAPRLLLPDDESQAFSKSTSTGAVVSISRPLANDNLSLGFTSTDDPNLQRAFSVPKTESVSAAGYAEPQPGTALEQIVRWFSRTPYGSLQVAASSTLGGLPKFRAQNVVEANTPEPWIANVGDATPSLQLSWPGKRPVNEIQITTTSSASIPTQVSITPAGGTATVLSLPAKGGVLKFPEIATDSLKIRFLRNQGHLSVTPISGVGVPLPVGVTGVTVPGLLTVPDPGPNPSTPVNLACGQGPKVTIDGKSVDTSVSTTLGDLINLRPATLTLCAPSTGLTLQAGRHEFLTSDSSSAFLISSLVMQPVAKGTVSEAPHRSVTVLNWSAEHRMVRVGAGPATYIVMPQNYNGAWTAHLGNEALRPVRIDGWEQGFLVPGGGAATISLTTPPNGRFQDLLLVGALLLIGLFALALVPSRRRNDQPEVALRDPSFWLLLGLSAAALVLVAGLWALVFVPLLAVARRWGRRPLIATAFVAFATAGLIAAVHPASSVGFGAGALDGPAQVASAVALASVFAALVVDSWPRGRNRTEATH